MEIKVLIGFEPKAHEALNVLASALTALANSSVSDHKSPVSVIEDDEETPAPVNPYATTKKAPKKKAAPVIEEDEETEEVEADEEDDFAPKKKAKSKKPSFDEDDEVEADDDDEEPVPAKKTKTPLATLDAVNDACKLRAKRTGGADGRAEVLAILKKQFKIKTVSELKPDQYAAVIKAMAV